MSCLIKEKIFFFYLKNLKLTENNTSNNVFCNRLLSLFTIFFWIFIIYGLFLGEIDSTTVSNFKSKILSR